MTEKDLKGYACRLAALSVFRRLLQDPVVAALLAYLSCEKDVQTRLSLYGKFVYELQEGDGSLAAALCRAVCEDENAYIKKVSRGKAVSPAMQANVQAELALFKELTQLTAKELCAPLDGCEYVPEFENQPTDITAIYTERLQHIERYGYGIFAGSGMFRVEQDAILPVPAADPISLQTLIGYEAEHQKVIDNTRALVEGRPAANVLLCGDAGTGKSSTVKAVANLFFEQGVRLIELRKDQLSVLPLVMGHIADHPLKFIIFIDDLSFNKNDDSFSMLKAALEGSASAKAPNAVIYATSNRRHIVKETFSDRTGDDVHRADTMQELISLSDRFGLTVYFEKPSKALYLEIVHELAARSRLQMGQAELDQKAEAFALGKGNRSPRAAEQFIKSLL